MKSERFNIVRKYLNRGIGILVAFLIFAEISTVLNYMYVARNSDWERNLWHYFYENNGKIDNLYLGSSHVYSGINAAMLDDLNGEFNFNLASARQRPISSYFLLKEADRTNSLSHVYLELFYWCSTNDDFDLSSETIFYNDNWKNIDYMKFSYNKFEYILHISETEKYIDTLFPFTRYRSYLGDWDYMKQTMESKRELDYLTYGKSPEGGYKGYKQGYAYSLDNFEDEDRMVEQFGILEKNPVGKVSEKYIRKIIDYCKDKDIDITLFCTPMDELQLISAEDYDNYINQMKGIAEEYDVEFYDFNLAKEEYLPIHDREHFRNADHLNTAGGDLFTLFFHEIVSGNPSENEKFFYDSYEEKLQAISPQLYGIYWRDSIDTEETRTFYVASNREEGMEYRIILSPDDKERIIIQDFMENKEFSRPKDEHGICTVVARMKDVPNDILTLEVNY